MRGRFFGRVGAGVWAVALALGAACGGLAPSGKLTAASQEDPGCTADLAGALAAFQRDLGLGFELSEGLVTALQASSALEVSYGRDGVIHTVEFGVDELEDGGCSLRLWSITTSQPGSVSTRSARCQCE
jgi:hypothetical protein